MAIAGLSLGTGPMLWVKWICDMWLVAWFLARNLDLRGGGVNPNGSVGVEGGRKPFYDVLMARERKFCDCT